MQPGIPTSHDVPSRKASTEKPSVSTKAEAIANAKRTQGEYQVASEIEKHALWGGSPHETFINVDPSNYCHRVLGIGSFSDHL